MPSGSGKRNMRRRVKRNTKIVMTTMIAGKIEEEMTSVGSEEEKMRDEMMIVGNDEGKTRKEKNAGSGSDGRSGKSSAARTATVAGARSCRTVSETVILAIALLSPGAETNPGPSATTTLI